MRASRGSPDDAGHSSMREPDQTFAG